MEPKTYMIAGPAPEDLRMDAERCRILLALEVMQLLIENRPRPVNFVMTAERGVELWMGSALPLLRRRFPQMRLKLNAPYRYIEENWAPEWRALFLEVAGAADEVRYLFDDEDKDDDGGYPSDEEVLRAARLRTLEESQALLAFCDDDQPEIAELIARAREQGLEVRQLP